jgi:tetratricopeptide (TPR) repeat protein
MQLRFHPRIAEQLADAPSSVRTAFDKQVRFLAENLRHPSLRAKKYDEANDIWQARVTRGWRSISRSKGTCTRSFQYALIRSSSQRLQLVIALARFRSAWAIGVAAVYANIGNTYLEWGNQLRDARLIAEAQSRCRRATEWLERAVDFGAGARLGKDSSGAEVALAEAYLGVGDLDRARPLVCEARDAAEKTSNQLDLACALGGVMAAVLSARGDREQAMMHGDDAGRCFEQLGHADRARGNPPKIQANALLFPLAIN